MSFLFSALSGSAAKDTQSGPETVAKLVDRATHSTLLEDRRAAVLGLKAMAKDYRMLVGTSGIPVLVNVLKSDRMDVEIIKAALETLNILCGYDEDQDGKDGREDLGRMFSEVYTKDPSNVTILLEILEEFEFYIRFNTIQFLTTLLETCGERLQECVLTSPIGIARLMDLLDDSREIIRNESLLLLIALTSNNAEIQKIIAFENAFERLLGIVLAEGASEGDIIVQDCLTLTLNLLRYNVSNQNLFRESSCIQKIPSLLLSHSVMQDARGQPVPVSLTHEANVWTSQKIINAELILELVRILVAPNSPNTTNNQKIMHQHAILGPIVELGMSSRVHMRVRTQALNAVGDVIRGNMANQEFLGKYVVMPTSKGNPNEIPTSAILCLVKIALLGESYALRASGAYCFQSFVFNNQDNQLALAATLTPPPFDNHNNEQIGEAPVLSPGSLAISSVLGWQVSKLDPYRTWFATVLLSHIVSENPRCQEMALSVKIDDSDKPISLLHKLMYALLVAVREAADIRVILGMFSFLATWLFGSSQAVKEFLSEGSNLQFLIEQVNASSGVDPLIQGMAAYIIAICHEYNDNSEASFTQASLQSLIVSRIGGDVFMSRIERLKDSKYFQKASLSFAALYLQAVDLKTMPEVYFDPAYVDLLKSSSGKIERRNVFGVFQHCLCRTNGAGCHKPKRKGRHYS
ncbi:p115 like vesicle tethering protein [Chytriomyces sp. MP71]|nr:p115 like vesicle tethering protein [Chytriomyces sp. MP71]